ncbi:MAG TPA: inorganic phosphate transporter [Tepidisphaeraceae bacterium]|jgi:PiT family inorganic phosphate transporter|nr:inorganic phosphate transporter [Tepidisphaeraceae bacterium]
MPWFPIAICLVALVFDFLNGFHDAANSIATIVSTRVLSPRWAVVWAAVFNFVAAFTFGTAVARTIGRGMIRLESVNLYVILAGLLGAILWNILTWYLGLPTSSSHALIGAYAGAAIARAGWGVIIPQGWTLTLVFIVLSPTIGLILGAGLMFLVFHLVQKWSPQRVDRHFRRLQFISAAFYSLGHGTNDAQKTMGIIAGVLYSAGILDQFYIPFWVVLMAHAAIALGTLAGGWRIVKTMGMKITKLRPVGGFCAEAASAASILGAALAGIPVSTTHTIAGAIMGVGSVHRLSAVRWGIARTIVWAWVLTIPLSALVAAVTFRLIHYFIPAA